MRILQKQALVGAFLAAGVAQAAAADIYEPPLVEAPPPVIYEEPVDYGGWYIRGDLDYHHSVFKGARYVTYGPPPGFGSFDFGRLRGTWSVGGGIGYQATSYLRGDVTLDYFAKSSFRGQTSGVCGGVPCVSVDTSNYSALLLMANTYVDIGTWHGVTPYVGFGIGGAHVWWDDLRNTVGGVTTVHRGAAEWRFAYALMAGASYCLTDNLKLDVGYRYANIAGGRMFAFAPVAGPGRDQGIEIHEGRAGLRYQFGGANGCYEPEPYIPPYVPPAEPPIYK